MRQASLIVLLCLCVGCGTPSLLITPVSNVQRLDEVVVQPARGWRPPKVVIIEVEGMLLNARTGGFLQAGENKLSLFTQQLERAAGDPQVRAVVLRINSPGGTVTTTDTMYQMLLEFREATGKPVVASAQEVTASGAYYVACGADRIIVHPTSVVGSVGVVFQTFNIEGTLDKLGIRNEAIKSGPMKDMGSPFQPLHPEARDVMQAMVDEYHQRFVSVVMRSRGIDSDEKLALATDGRIFSGEQAVEVGLADGVGRLDDAIDLARVLADVPNAQAVMYKRPYGYTGSIYASHPAPEPRANTLELKVPGLPPMLPAGFYYLWQP